MNYIITDGERYIHNNGSGKYVPIRNERMATMFTKEKAENIYNSCLSKEIRKTFAIVNLPDEQQEIKPVEQEDIDNTEKTTSSNNIKNLLDKVDEISVFAEDVYQRKQELILQLSTVDKELCDLLHYCEFCNLNAAQGYKAYKMIKERRIRRRSIKDEMEVITVILNKNIGSSVKREINKTLSSMDHRHYEPRVLKELFNV